MELSLLILGTLLFVLFGLAETYGTPTKPELIPPCPRHTWALDRTGRMFCTICHLPGFDIRD